ncbi:DUF4181 domain-containing protein [[Bacillus] enclensis]|uniref:DUF4181 domain-containing protein n=1 Tax=[Bacillus] enclensis TaxID=1402860 RepID=UPI0018DE7168|nr:DUF4181 domain-containing protein [[Bacillus] enclensis]
MPFLLTSLFIVLCAFDAFMQWRHRRSDKEYIISVLALTLIIFASSLGNPLNII